MNRIFPLLVLSFAGAAAYAHHSFAVFFDSDRTVSVTGAVVDFQFRNPHGLVRIRIADKEGRESIWKAETNSPSILVRRGWSKDSLTPGEVVTMDGWPARDGSNYMRLRTLKRADGSMVGRPVAATEEK